MCFRGSQGEKGKCFILSSNTQVSEPSCFRTLCCIFFFLFPLCWVFTAVDKLFLVVASEGHSPVEVPGLLIAGASLVAEHRL